jgi:hypothetical protein
LRGASGVGWTEPEVLAKRRERTALSAAKRAQLRGEHLAELLGLLEELLALLRVAVGAAGATKETG